MSINKEVILILVRKHYRAKYFGTISTLGIEYADNKIQYLIWKVYKKYNIDIDS